MVIDTFLFFKSKMQGNSKEIEYLIENIAQLKNKTSILSIMSLIYSTIAYIFEIFFIAEAIYFIF